MLLSGLDTYFLEISAHALLKVATKRSFRGKKSKNLALLDYFFGIFKLFFWSKNGGVRPKRLKCLQ